MLESSQILPNMKRKLFFLAFLLFVFSGFSQTVYKKINSSKLGTERELKIQLPRDYEQESKKTYPVILVLDGDYLFEPMAGNVDYLSYWDEIPEAIVVGINQDGNRETDTFYDEKTNLPIDTGADFFEFIGMEVMPFLDENYQTGKFLVIAGHNSTANFIDFYLLKEQPLFNAYINLSPDFAPEMIHRLSHNLGETQKKRWFFLATASNDIPELKQESEKLDKVLASYDNPKLHYNFSIIQNANHYTMVGRAIPQALASIFSSYAPITEKEYDNRIVMAASPYDYLIDKYKTISEYFDLDIRIRINDFLAIGKALEFNQKWNDLEKLGKLAVKEYPDSMLGLYYLARSYEANGKPKKAMRTYQNA